MRRRCESRSHTHCPLSEAQASRVELAEQPAARYSAELEMARAIADADIGRAQVQAQRAQELAESRVGEIARLVDQVEDLRGELRWLAAETEKGKSAPNLLQMSDTPLH